MVTPRARTCTAGAGVVETADTLRIVLDPTALFDSQEVVAVLRKAVIANDFQPVFCGAALRNKGIHRLLDGVVALRTVNVGDRLENMGNNTPAFRIVDNRLLDLTFTVPSTEMSKVQIVPLSRGVW